MHETESQQGLSSKARFSFIRITIISTSIFLQCKFKQYYYSFKIFPRFGLVETTRIIHHNQLLFTKFGKNLRHIQSMTSKVEPAANYSTVDVKMTSKVEPAADYSTVDRKTWGRDCDFGEQKNQERNGETPLRTGKYFE